MGSEETGQTGGKVVDGQKKSGARAALGFFFFFLGGRGALGRFPGLGVN